MDKHLWKLVVVAVALPIAAVAAEWHMVPDEVYPDVPLTRGSVVGALLVNSIKKSGDHAEAQVSMFYSYDLAQAAISKVSAKDSDVRSKLDAAIASGRPSAYAGMEHLFTCAGFISYSDDEIRTLLVASEILIDEGYAPMSTRTIQVQCKSKLDFGYRYDESGNWALFSLPSDGSAKRGELYPFICDKAGMGQNERTLPPSPTPEMALLQQIASGVVLPKWKFLGVNTDGYGRRYFVFFAGNTMQKKKKYTDVVVGSLHSGYGSSPEGLISGIQAGKYRPDSLNITHVHCDTEDIGDDFSGAKLFETQLVSYVCAHQKN